MFQIQSRLLPVPRYQTMNLVFVWIWSVFERMMAYAATFYTLHEMYYVLRIPEITNYVKSQIMRLAPYEYTILQIVYLGTTAFQCAMIVLAARQVATNIENTQETRRKIMMESKPEPRGFENPIVY